MMPKYFFYNLLVAVNLFLFLNVKNIDTSSDAPQNTLQTTSPSTGTPFDEDDEYVAIPFTDPNKVKEKVDSSSKDSFFLKYSETCNETRTDEEIVLDMYQSSSSYEVSLDDATTENNTLIATTLSGETSSNRKEARRLLLSKFIGETPTDESNRLSNILSLSLAGVTRRRMAQKEPHPPSKAVGVLGQEFVGLTQRRSLGELNNREEMRDRLIAILGVLEASNENQRQPSGFDEEKALEIDALYLAHLNMDIITTSSEKQAANLMSISKRLPCNEVTPEFNKIKVPSELIPNDMPHASSHGHQWAMFGPATEIAREVYGTNIVKSWEVQKGSIENPIVVAVVDTGCSMNPDLESSLCEEGEACAGYDFGDGDNNPFNEPTDRVHGTPVSGVIAAQPGNKYGISGVCWACKVMCLKVYNSESKAMTMKAVLEAMNYILAKKVRLSNHSYSGFGYSGIEEAAWKALDEAGHLGIVSAGNNNCDVDNAPNGERERPGMCKNSDGEYRGKVTPAAYNLDSIVAVGAHNRDGYRSPFSNWGKVSVDLFAPGTNVPSIYNTREEARIAIMSGTSFSAPLVTGVAALIMTQNKHLTHKEVREIILSTVKKHRQFKDLSSSGGILDAHEALLQAGGSKQNTPFQAARCPTVDRTNEYYGGTSYILNGANINPSTEPSASNFIKCWSNLMFLTALFWLLF